MNKELSGKGHIQGGEGCFVASTGERYHYHDGGLTQVSATLTDQTGSKPQGVIEMKYQGTFELQPLYDGHESFYGKAFVERWDTENGTRYVLRSYGTVVATVTPVSAWDARRQVFRVEIAMRHLSATTLRHVKEFLAQADDTFQGVTLAWLRKAVESGEPVDGAESAWRKVYTLDEL